MKRRAAREEALKLLYQADIQKTDAREILEQSDWQDEGQPAVGKEFTTELVEGVTVHRKEIDKRISDYAIDWSLERMPLIDRNILRMSVFEILYCEDIPIGVSINEAVELAKKYSTETSGKFVNGILGKITKE